MEAMENWIVNKQTFEYLNTNSFQNFLFGVMEIVTRAFKLVQLSYLDTVAYILQSILNLGEGFSATSKNLNDEHQDWGKFLTSNSQNNPLKSLKLETQDTISPP